jgi:hypothetical protein
MAVFNTIGLERFSKLILAASERDFAFRRGVEPEHRRVLGEGFDNDAWARKTLAEPEGHF